MKCCISNNNKQLNNHIKLFSITMAWARKKTPDLLSVDLTNIDEIKKTLSSSSATLAPNLQDKMEENSIFSLLPPEPTSSPRKDDA